ncbi:MAG TPA: hypothetical protein VGR40_06990, partial [Candidatus Binatus sp.]|nr:hypothetical protein [Candidatus Binatus sp.]
EAQEREASARNAEDRELKLAQLERKRRVMEAQIESIRAEFEADAMEMRKAIELEDTREQAVIDNQAAMAKSRRVNGQLPQDNDGE